MNDLTIIAALLTGINVVILGLSIKLYSEMVKWRVLDQRK